MLSVGGLTLAIGLRFWALGAWPVLPFGVLEVGLVLWLLRLNNRQSRATELIVLSEDEVRIVRTTIKGARQEIAMPSGWLSVALEERDGRVPRLLLRRHRLSAEIGSALGEREKRDLAANLERVLDRMRHPVFDNTHVI